MEAALQLVEREGGEVTAVSMGPDAAVAAVQRALAMGAHRGVLVSDDALRGADALATAKVLAAALRRGSFDLVIGGVESTDGYTGTVPATVAELLGLPSATFARTLDVAGRHRADRAPDRDRLRRRGGIPCRMLVTVTAGATDPRYPSLKGVMQAKQKPLERLTLSDLRLSADDVAPSQSVVEVTDAPAKAAGEVITADDDAAARIADLLAEAKVI